MVVELTLEASVNRVYEVLAESLYQEIKLIHPKIKRADVKTGFTYKKVMTGKMKQEATTLVKIEELTLNQVYHASFKSDRGMTSIVYRLNGDDKECHVSYEETFTSDKMLTTLNYKLVSSFYKKSSRKKVIRLLRQIEAYIKQDKEN